MPLFVCSKCGCIDNSAPSNVWLLWYKQKPPLCTECNPKMGKWHNMFPKEKLDLKKEMVGSDGKKYRYVIDDNHGTMPGRLDSIEVSVLEEREKAIAAAEAKRQRRGRRR